MKNLFTLFSLTWLLAYGAVAQDHCHFGFLIDKQMQQDPNYAAKMAQLDADVRNYLQQNPNGGNNRAVRTISVAVHVVYNTTAENVSTASINNLMNTLNADYRRTNADASQTRSAFLGVAADAQIEFCLDTIIRRSTTKTCFDPDTETDDMKFNASGGSTAMDPRYFLNIWIVDLCGNTGGGVAGYAYLPTPGVPGSSVDGLVIDYSLGYDNGTGRTATHEIGHYLGLPHPWGSDSNPSCSTDDGFSDTPNTDGPNYTCNATNSCGTPAPGDQYENFMDYSYCSNMFTTQQANYMNAVLTNSRSSLFNGTGCNTVGSAPIADFSASTTVACVGQAIDFTDASAGAPNSWAWTFTGGTPASSTVQNPSVTYNAAGTYTVSLTVTNANGTDTETKVNYITVVSAGNLPVTEGFQNATFPTAGWQLINPDNAITWARTTGAGGYGLSTASMFVNNYDYDVPGSQDLMLLPPVNFTGITNGRLTFDYAYAQYTGTSGTASDTLIIVVSVDCGETFYLLQKKGGTQLATRTATGSRFTPTAAQWKTDTISLAALAGQPNVQIGFLSQTGYGNNLYVDNINLSQPAVTQPPVANFVGNPTTVPVGSSVAFTDLSTNSPTSWSWQFSGGTPATSTAQNPTITYNTVGTYAVTLTATNGFGNDSETKVNYINVIQPTAGGCDTIDIFNATDSLRLYYADNVNPSTDGYLSGHNKYGDVAKANVYTPLASGNTVTGVFMYFGVAKTISNASINVRVWNGNGTGGAPNTVLASQTVAISSLSTTGFTYIPFTTPATVTGNYYVGIEFAYAAGDTVALLTNSVFSGNANAAWEKFGNGTWSDYTTSWGVNLKHIIYPIECAPSGPLPSANFAANATTICAGGTVTYTNTSTNATSYNWTFAGGNPSTSTATSPTVTYATAGTYTVTLVATGTNGQDTETRTNYITVRSNPVPTATATNVTCNGGTNGSINVSVTSGTSPYAYLWNGGSTQQNRTGLAAGTYTVTVTDANGCTGTTSVTVTQPTPITANATPTAATCAGADGSATVTASGGTTPYTYAWSTGGATQTINSLVPGTYSVTVSSANGCTAIANTVVSGPSIVTLSTSTTQANCNQTNGSVTLTVNGGTAPYTYAWNNGANTQNLTGVAAGTYTVTVTPTSGCTATATATVTNIGGATASVTVNSNVTCFNGSNGSLTASASGGNGSYTYVWSNSGTGATITNLTAGNYVVTVTDGNGCIATANGTVTQPTQVVASVSTQTNVSCFGGNNGAVTVSATGGSGSYTFNWNGGFTGATRTNLTAGTYTVTAVDNNNCSSAPVQVTITAPSQLAANITSVNPGCTSSNGSATVTATGGTTPYNYAWSSGANTATASNLVAGNYTVTVTDNNGCTISASATLTATNGPTATITATPVSCGATNDGSASVAVSGGTPPYSYLWSDAAGQISATATNLLAGSYTVTVTDNAGCSITQTVTVGTLGPNVTVSQVNVTGCFGNSNGSISLNVSGGQAPYNYTWSNSQSTQNIFTLTAGTYTVTVTDNSGCATIKSVTLTEPSELQANIQVTPTLQGQSTGTASVTVTGGTAPYIYNWDNGGTGTTTTGLGAGQHSVAVTDANNCVRTFTFTITVGTDVADLNNQLGIKIFPNPNTGKFVVNVSNNSGEATQVEVYNTLGQQIFVSEVKMNALNAFEVDLSSAPANTYFVKVISGNETVVRKVLRIN